MVNLEEYRPTEIVEIEVGDLTAPVETGVELSKLFAIEKGIVTELLQDIERDEETGNLIIPPELLAWNKELRLLAKEINDMTKGVQEEAMKKQIDIVGEIYKKSIKNMDDENVVKLIRNLENGNRDSIDITPES